MNNLDLFEAFNGIDDEFIEAASKMSEKKKKNISFKMWAISAACICVIISMTSITFAVDYMEKEQNELYIRHLTNDVLEFNYPENGYEISENNSANRHFDADKFFSGLNSDDNLSVYVSINRLVECYNNPNLRQEAIEKITPFLKSETPKIAEAADFALDILTQKFESPYLYEIADGKYVYAPFPNYSDYGSHNVLLCIDGEKIYKVFSFTEPSEFISEISVSPDGKLVAVATCSYKSSFVTVFDIENGLVSPEIVGSARIMCANDNGEEALMRVDGETYCDARGLTWKDNDTVSFDAVLTSDNYETKHDAVVEYNFAEKDINIIYK